MGHLDGIRAEAGAFPSGSWLSALDSPLLPPFAENTDSRSLHETLWVGYTSALSNRKNHCQKSSSKKKTLWHLLPLLDPSLFPLSGL